VNWTLELIVVPVSDVDRAKSFYADQMGFRVDVDHRAGESFRVVQLSPPGSACSIALMKVDQIPGGRSTAGAVQGLHLCVPDIEAARAELVGRGAEVSDYFHFGDTGQTPGLHPRREMYGTFLSLSDPDGNGWLVQEVNRAAAAS
jgi:catechol 2,3-dioxygenase-like lactoylglutathione lyase family enzyme